MGCAVINTILRLYFVAVSQFVSTFERGPTQTLYYPLLQTISFGAGRAALESTDLVLSQLVGCQRRVLRACRSTAPLAPEPPTLTVRLQAVAAAPLR